MSPRAPISPADIARWAFWVPLRDALDPAHPGRARALYPAWRLQHRLARSGRALMAEEYRRWLGELPPGELDALIAKAYRSAFRVHLDELLLGRLSPDTLDQWVRFEGLHHLDAALSLGKGVVWTYPHAGAIMLMLAGLALKGYPTVQYAARGLAPEEVAKDHPELLASNRLREAVRRVREENEDRLPVTFLTLQHSARELYRRLAANEVVFVAYDGRIGARWAPLDYLGRTALLSPGPSKLAGATGAPIVPAFCRTPAKGPCVVEIGTPITPTRDWKATAAEVLAVEEAWLRRWPEEYGIWLLHVRQRNHIDDHPMFVDHAADGRWRKWVD